MMLEDTEPAGTRSRLGSQATRSSQAQGSRVPQGGHRYFGMDGGLLGIILLQATCTGYLAGYLAASTAP